MRSQQARWRLQYALQHRALARGWHPDAVEGIDADLGLTAAAAQHRPGFPELVAKLTLGQVGISLAFDVTRRARTCSAWSPLLDLCAYKRCLIAARDGVDDPASPSGRLRLGLKGQRSAFALPTLRARLPAGLLNHAARGALALPLPPGRRRAPTGTVSKDPNRAVQERRARVRCQLPPAAVGAQGLADAAGRGTATPLPRPRRRHRLARPTRRRHPGNSAASCLGRRLRLWPHAHDTLPASE